MSQNQSYRDATLPDDQRLVSLYEALRGSGRDVEADTKAEGIAEENSDVVSHRRGWGLLFVCNGWMLEKSLFIAAKGTAVFIWCDNEWLRVFRGPTRIGADKVPGRWAHGLTVDDVIAACGPSLAAAKIIQERGEAEGGRLTAEAKARATEKRAREAEAVARWKSAHLGVSGG